MHFVVQEINIISHDNVFQFKDIQMMSRLTPPGTAGWTAYLFVLFTFCRSFFKNVDYFDWIVDV